MRNALTKLALGGPGGLLGVGEPGFQKSPCLVRQTLLVQHCVHRILLTRQLQSAENTRNKLVRLFVCSDAIVCTTVLLRDDGTALKEHSSCQTSTSKCVELGLV